MIVMITMTVIAMYEVKTVMNIGKKAAEEKAANAEKRKEAAMREAIEAEKRRLEETGYKVEDEVNAVESGETDEKEND